MAIDKNQEAAMIKLYDSLMQPSVERTDKIRYVLDYLEHYRFHCAILVNYDLWEQSQVFINVNFKQKPVNKSLYYEVFGSEYQDQANDPKRNVIYHAHTLVRRMNEYIVTIYLDNEDDSGMSYSFPTKADFDVRKEGDRWVMDADDMKISFDTSRY